MATPSPPPAPSASAAGTAGTFSLNSVSGSTSASNVFTLIDNSGGSAISNPPLTGAAEGASTTVNGLTAYSYAGGNGQSLTLTVAGAPSLSGSGSLVLQRIVSGSEDNLQLLQAGVVIDSRPTASVSNPYAVTGAANTTLTIDYTQSGGFFQKDVTFTGSSNTNALLVKDPSAGFGNMTFNDTGAHSGNIKAYSDAAGTLLLNTITYSQLAPLTNTGTVTDYVFNLPAGTVGASLQDDGTPANNTSELTSTNATFETTTFTEPTSSLTVNGGGGTDTIATAAGFSGDFNAALTINGTTATDTVNLNALALGNGGVNTGNLTVTGQTINTLINTSAAPAACHDGRAKHHGQRQYHRRHRRDDAARQRCDASLEHGRRDHPKRRDRHRDRRRSGERHRHRRLVRGGHQPRRAN